MQRRLGISHWSSVGLAVAAGLLAVGAADAGQVTLAVDPTQLILAGAAKDTLTVRNPTGDPIVLRASLGNYSIQPDGTVIVDPKLPPKLSAKQWLTISPKTFTLAPHTSGLLTVRSHPSKDTDPGDHHALVLFTTAPTLKGQVRVRTRIGIMVLVRVAGKIRRHIVISQLSVDRKKHKLRLTLYNRGNINERLLRHHVGVVLTRGRRIVEKVFAPARDILPHSRSVYRLPYRESLKGRLTATVVVRPANHAVAGAFAPPLRPLKKKFRVRF